jgi:hypothetical protein
MSCFFRSIKPSFLIGVSRQLVDCFLRWTNFFLRFDRLNSPTITNLRVPDIWLEGGSPPSGESRLAASSEVAGSETAVGGLSDWDVLGEDTVNNFRCDFCEEGYFGRESIVDLPVNSSGSKRSC